MVQLSDELVDDLDRVAAARGVSRSALIRDALIEYLAEMRDADVGRQIVAGYTKIPPATPDAWGDPSAVAQAGTSDLLVRLDVEERDAGDDPW